MIIEVKLPSTATIGNTADFWLVLLHTGPSIFAFVLSFGIILITWVNHHNILKLINKSSASFIYANGFLLLSVVFIPFPTALLGEYLLNDHSAPAVILHVSTMSLQALGWILLLTSALKNQLSKDERSATRIRESNKYGFFAFIMYSLCAVIAFWFPLTIAIITTLIWSFWLIWGINVKSEQMND